MEQPASGDYNLASWVHSDRSPGGCQWQLFVLACFRPACPFSAKLGCSSCCRCVRRRCSSHWHGAAVTAALLGVRNPPEGAPIFVRRRGRRKACAIPAVRPPLGRQALAVVRLHSRTARLQPVDAQLASYNARPATVANRCPHAAPILRTDLRPVDQVELILPGRRGVSPAAIVLRRHVDTRRATWWQRRRAVHSVDLDGRTACCCRCIASTAVLAVAVLACDLAASRSA